MRDPRIDPQPGDVVTPGVDSVPRMVEWVHQMYEAGKVSASKAAWLLDMGLADFLRGHKQLLDSGALYAVHHAWLAELGEQIRRNEAEILRDSPSGSVVKRGGEK